MYKDLHFVVVTSSGIEMLVNNNSPVHEAAGAAPLTGAHAEVMPSLF
jgi:hypothetical protein